MKKTEKVYDSLLNNYGEQHWWPVLYGKSRKGRQFEICVGAILTQNTSWKNVEKALRNLRDADLLSSNAMINTNFNDLANAIISSGYYSQKAKKLKIFAEFFVKEFEELENAELSKARERLLSLYGIGKETADSMLLYALNRPIFVIDAYTKRVFARLLGLDFKEYDEWQEYFHDDLSDVKNQEQMFSEYHALIVEHAKRFCRKKPLCEKCFLSKVCLTEKGLKRRE